MALTIDAKEYVTAAQAAEMLGTTLPRVLMLLREHALEGMQVDGVWYVEKKSAACATAHGREMKAVKGCASHCSSGGCGCQ